MVWALQATQHAGCKIDFFNALVTGFAIQPDLVDAALMMSIARVSATDREGDVRDAAQRTLAVIVQNRPDLADAVLISEAKFLDDPVLNKSTSALLRLVS